MKRPCLRWHPALVPDECPSCWRAANDGYYQRMWGLPVTAMERVKPPPASQAMRFKIPDIAKPKEAPPLTREERTKQIARVKVPCVYRTALHIAEEMQGCGACRIYGCSKHGQCTLTPRGNGVKDCLHCDDYLGQKPVLDPRHLLYHIYPCKGDVWKRNLDQLRTRLGLFNGRRVIAVATDSKIDSLEAVQAYFDGERVDQWIAVANNPKRREVETWPLLWEQVAGLPGCTFYGHAKGVTRPVKDGVMVHRWAEVLYEACLDYWPVVEDLLAQFPIAGCFQKIGPVFAKSRSQWHYSGSFYWVRNDLIGERWKTIDQIKWGVESWPGVHWDKEQAGVIFARDEAPKLDLYRKKTWERIEAGYANWKARNEAKRG